jgi:pimeloyl-ACP methyl ester carboxylesterase
MTAEDSPHTQQFRFGHIQTNGLRLYVVEAGEGPPVLFLHGFPEFWYSWRHQLTALAAAGYQAIAPDLRGYNRSEKPEGISGYRTRELVADVVGLIKHIGSSPLVLVGHDWGGIVAWRVAALHPELLSGLVILNSPHPTAFRTELLRNPLQVARSYYALLFQLPRLPERVLELGDFALLARALRTQPRRPSAFTSADIELYKQTWRDGGLRAPLHYYRAALRYPGDLLDLPHHVDVPTRIVWGAHDPYLSSRLAPRSSRWAAESSVHMLAGASHWVQNDAPEEVTAQLLDFLREAPLSNCREPIGRDS